MVPELCKKNFPYFHHKNQKVEQKTRKTAHICFLFSFSENFQIFGNQTRPKGCKQFFTTSVTYCEMERT